MNNKPINNSNMIQKELENMAELMGKSVIEILTYLLLSLVSIIIVTIIITIVEFHKINKLEDRINILENKIFIK